METEIKPICGNANYELCSYTYRLANVQFVAELGVTPKLRIPQTTETYGIHLFFLQLFIPRGGNARY